MPFAASTPRYAFKTSQRPTGSVTGAVSPSATINPGDMIMWDPVAQQYTPVTATADGPAFAGIAFGQIPIASNIDNQTGLESKLEIGIAGVYLMKTEAANTYLNGDSVQIGTVDAQSVIIDTVYPAAPGANSIGQVFLPDGTSVVGGTGVFVPVLIKNNFMPFIA